MDTATGNSPFFIIHPATTPAMENVPPTERSKVPLTSSSIMPQTMIPSNARLRRMAVKLPTVGKMSGKSAEFTAINRSMSPTSMVSRLRKPGSFIWPPSPRRRLRRSA